MCVQFSVMLCMRDHTRVCLQLCEVPAAASGADEGSSSLESCVCECVFSFRRPMQIWVWSAAGVSHSLGRQLCRNGIQELKYANRFTQRGISLPHSNYGERERENKMMWECRKMTSIYVISQWGCIWPSPMIIYKRQTEKGIRGVNWPQTARKKNGCSFCASGGRRSPWIPFPAPPLFYQCPPLQSLSYPKL